MDNSPNMEDFMLQKKLDIMFEMNNRKIASEISKLGSMISSLSQEIDSIKKQLGRASVETRQNPTNAAEQDFEGFREIPSNSVRPKPNDDVKPRFGDYNPEDVPIGKIFYFGNKKPR